MKNERLNQLIELDTYKEAYKAIQKSECNTQFCHHDIQHFLDVARIAWIHNLEEQHKLSQEIVYAAAFLHDIGRYQQYTQGVPHNTASALLAVPMLEECGYSPKEVTSIKTAILFHRSKAMALSCDEPLAHILYRADKESRCCHTCLAEPECNWEIGKKNMYITY